MSHTATTRRDFLWQFAGTAVAVVAVGAGALAGSGAPPATRALATIRINGEVVGYAPEFTLVEPGALGDVVTLDLPYEVLPATYSCTFTCPAARSRRE